MDSSPHLSPHSPASPDCLTPTGCPSQYNPPLPHWSCHPGWASRRFSIIPAILGAKWGWMLGCVFAGGFRRGSCVHDKNKILLNIKLIMAPTHSIEYVVVNDRCLLKYLNNAAEFYDFHSIVILNLKERKEKI